MDKEAYIPIKVMGENWETGKDVPSYFCPRCQEVVSQEKDFWYCSNCHRELHWEEVV